MLADRRRCRVGPRTGGQVAPTSAKLQQALPAAPCSGLAMTVKQEAGRKAQS